MPEDKRPTQFVWHHAELGDDGMVGVGTLADWARMWERDYYAGGDGLTRLLLTWDGADKVQYHLVEVKYVGKDENDWMKYHITASHCNDEAWVTIDGRA